MYDLYADHWDTIRSTRSMRVAIVFSIVVHSIVAYTLMTRLKQPPPKRPIPITHHVEFLALPTPEPEKKVAEKAPPPPPPKPKPKVKKPEPKKKVEPKKVVKKKEVKKKKPPPKKKPPEKKKEPVVKKTPPKKKEPEVVKKVPPMPKPEVVEKAQPKSGVQTKQLPTVLSAWGRLVQRKVEKYWQVPGGVGVTDANKEVHISFWVDRDGRLLSSPEIVKDAADPSLGASGVRAIMMAEPLPPLPNEYQEDVAQVIYVFTLTK